MSKHFKAPHLRPPDSPKHENWKRRQRRKRLKARLAERRYYMASWVDRAGHEVAA